MSADSSELMDAADCLVEHARRIEAHEPSLLSPATARSAANELRQLRSDLEAATSRNALLQTQPAQRVAAPSEETTNG